MDESISMNVSLVSQNTQEIDSIDDGIGNGQYVSDTKRAWGRLLPINSLFSSVDLYDKDYSFGRGKSCSIVWNTDTQITSKYFLAYSSTHFQIKYDDALKNNDEIALASKSHSVYIYMDSNEVDDQSIPKNIKDKYIVSKTIGRGTYGEVKLCFVRGTCDRYAMKIISKAHFAPFTPQANAFNQTIKSEYTILQALNHPCIISTHELFDTPDAIYMILELVDGGELFNRIVMYGQLDEATTKFIFRQICIGVKYLHDHSITHRDLKPENILLSSADTNESLIKITDFGLSRFFTETSLMKTFCGTPNYLAPEVLATRGEGRYTNKIDIWSLGVILYICLVGYPPFSESADSPKLGEQILRGLYTFPDEFWSHVSTEAKDLICRMMCVDPSKRLTIVDVLEHPWLANDHENTARVEKIMEWPSQIMKNMKRPASLESDSANDDAMEADKNFSSTNRILYARNKRAKH